MVSLLNDGVQHLPHEAGPVYGGLAQVADDPLDALLAVDGECVGQEVLKPVVKVELVIFQIPAVSSRLGNAWIFKFKY